MAVTLNERASQSMLSFESTNFKIKTMNKTTTRFTLILSLVMSMAHYAQSQMIWPGDVNNNGIVNGVDMLSWGIAYNNSGAPRTDASTNWEAQPLTAMWSDNFPGNINYAYADGDGNGVVTMLDFENAIKQNYRLTHGFVTPDGYNNGQTGVNVPLALRPSVTSATPGTRVDIDIYLGDQVLPVGLFHGITFTLRYNQEFVETDGVFFQAEQGAWYDAGNANSANFFYVNQTTGLVELTFTRLDQQNTSGFGKIGTVSFIISQSAGSMLPGLLKVEVENVKMIDANMNTYAVARGDANVELEQAITSSSCPDIISPVCGSNGVTYINSCYAEAAGVTDYTEGVCFGSCINPQQMNPNANCNYVYQPVCGCNGVTYINECVASSNGVTSYTSGPCSANSTCYDPVYVVTSSGTTENSLTGVISLNCTANYQPVCGCNGITYPNACIAEASGITFYTAGACNTNCVNPSEMDPQAVCPTIYQPVCGCNGVTYSNSCVAEAAGVVSYTPGTCGASSQWCAEAVPIQCGDYFPYETTVGAGNQISSYPGCSGGSFLGADKVYVLNKTTAGDLQIGIEIMTANLDLDLFLLSGNCGQLTCLRASTTNNSQTNNEGIILEDAPIGTYYIVVDGQQANSQGAYRLEVSCGYLYCGDAVPLTCGQTYSGNTINGDDNVSLYGCGNVLNVENNGPEMVHYFSVTQAGQVTVNLSGLSDNLELFLLRSCDRGDCINYSQNAGNSNETITAFLQPGVYYVVVDGYNGATSAYNLTVNCSTASACNFSIVNTSATPAGCGQNNGSITVVSAGGHPGYIVQYSGPVSGSFATYANSNTIYNLPAGTYTITKTDCFGCYDTEVITVPSGGNLSASVTPHAATCGMSGYLSVVVLNGQAPYSIYLTGPVNRSLTANSSSFNITNLPAGYYTLYITSANGCSIVKYATITQSSSSFNFTATPHPGACGQPGYINIQTTGGIPPYNISVSGPISGYATSSSSNFNIINLPGGTYTITIEDGNWCTVTRVVYLSSSHLNITATPSNGVCGQYGSITVAVTNGSAPYIINWNGPVSGSATTNNPNYVIQNLPSGTYSIFVEDGNWCSGYKTVYLNNSGGSLSTSVSAENGGCGQAGSIWIDINNGVGPYVINWTGPASGSATTGSPWYNIPNLPGGSYFVTIADANGCSSQHTVYVISGGNFAINAQATNGLCGQYGSIQVTMVGGTPNYLITWNGPVSGSITTGASSYTIPNLPPGPYSIQVTDAQGCTRNKNVTVTNTGGGLVLTGTVVHATCVQYGAIWLDIAGASAPYTISWVGTVNGSTTIQGNGYNIANLPSGTYVVTVVAANGCTGTKTFTVLNQGGNISLTLIANNANCAQQYGAINVIISGGVSPYTIAWTGPVSGSATTNNTSYQIPSLPAGTYTVTVTSANGCSGTNYVTINASGNLNIVTTPIPGLCGMNGSIWLDINNGSAPYTITWSGPVNGSITIQGNGYNIPNLPAGTYLVTVTGANGCTDSEVVILTTTSATYVVNTALINNGCGQYNWIWIDIIGGSPTYTIIWTGPVSGSGTSTTGAFEIQDLPPGTYTIKVTDATGCMVIRTVIIYQDTVNRITLTPAPGPCGQNGAIGVVIQNAVAPYVLSWTGPVSGSTNLANNSYNITNLPSGTYTVSLVDANGCSDLEVITINNNQNPLDVTGVAVHGVCGQNGQIHLGITGATTPYSIVWTGPVNGSATTSNNFYNILNLPSGTYSVVVTAANGCVDNVVVTLNNGLNTLEVIGVAVPGLCGQNGQIHLGITGGTLPYSIVWTGPVNGSATTSNNFYNILNLPNGTYTIVVTDGNGCTDTVVVTLTNGPNTLEVTGVAVPGVCGQNGQIHLGITGATGPYTITWTGTVSGNATTSNNFYNIVNLPSGTYTIVVTSAGGCVDTVVITLTNGVNTLDVTGVAVPGICGQNGQIHLGITGGTAPYSIVWTGAVNGTTTTSNNFYNILNLPSGTYTIVVTDANGCTDTVVVTLTNAPNNLAFTLTPTNGICGLNGSILVTINNGSPVYTINWAGPVNGSATTAASTYTIPNLPGGTYTVMVTDVNGCSKQMTTTIAITESDIDITGTANTGFCGQEGSVGLIISGGTGTYNIVWSGPESGSATSATGAYTIIGLPSGTYSVTVTDGNGCTETEITNLNNAEDDLALVATPVGLCGQLGSINLNISGGNAPYTITWGGPSSGTSTTNNSTFTIPNLQNGSYTVGVTDVNGCFDSKVVTVSSPGGVSLTTTGTNATCVSLASINGTITGGTPSYTISWTGPVSGSQTTANTTFNIPNLPGGTYQVTILSANGCTATSTVTLTAPAFNLDLTATPNPGLCGHNGSILVNITGGMPGYVISWSGPLSGMITTFGNSYTISNTPNGVYTINVTDASGCTDSQTVTIVNTNTGLIIDVTPVHGLCGSLGSIWIDILNGTGPYTVMWTGPISGSTVVTGDFYDIPNTPNGTYTIKVTDAYNCMGQRTVVITNAPDNLTASLTPHGGTCDGPGSITVTINGTFPPYTVSWNGTNSMGTATTSGPTYTINGLPTGIFSVTVTDSQGCTENLSTQVINSSNSISASFFVTNGNCTTQGAIAIVFHNAAPPYTVSWNGTTSGTIVWQEDQYQLTNLPHGDYVITITDANGCVYESDEIWVDGQLSPPTANFTHSTSSLTTTFTNTSTPGTYLWSFGDGTTSTAANPVHQYYGAGSYQVCLAVTNACGTSNICKTVNIVLPTSLVILDVGEGSGSPGVTISIPVRIQNCQNLVSLAGSLSLQNPSVAAITGLLPALIAPQYNATNKTFNYFNNGGQGLSVSQNDILFYITVQLNGAPGTSTDIFLVNTPLPVEVGSMSGGNGIVLPHMTVLGKATVSNMAMAQGFVETFWGEGIPDVAVSATDGSMVEMQMTDALGHYSLPELPINEEFVFEAAKDTMPSNGLSTYALFIGQRFILGLEPIQIYSPYQVIAGDANCNNAFTTLDLFLIQQLIIGAKDKFEHCPSWVFVSDSGNMPDDFDAYNVFPYYSRDTMMVMNDVTANFIGVKVGDILGQADPGLFQNGQEVDDRYNDELVLVANKKGARAGEEIELTFRSDNFNDIVSYQTALGFDANALEYLEVAGGNAQALSNVVAGSKAGTVRLSWFHLSGSGISAMQSEGIFTIRFRAKQNIEDLSNVLHIEPRGIRTEAHNAHAERLDIVLRWEDGAPALGYELYQNTPNPFSNETAIRFDLPEDMAAELIIQDEMGRTIQHIKGDYVKGTNRIELSQLDLAGGVYFYTLKAGAFAATKSMVVLKK